MFVKPTKANIYYLSQLAGWLGYVIIAAFLSNISGTAFNSQAILSLLLVFVLGFSISHSYRELVRKWQWIRYPVVRLIPRVLLAVALQALVLELFFIGIFYALYGALAVSNSAEFLSKVLNWSVLFFIWSALYFAFHFFVNYRREEIKNLQLQATKKEIELNKLKSQLNPHFIFNSMNTIRALIDEEPAKAKKSITQLSNILRNTLTMDKHELIPMHQELKVVTDYLEIEKARFEERLHIELNINPRIEKVLVPPLLFQTLVENAIKHGISKLPKGGKVKFQANLEGDFLKACIENDGVFRVDPNPDSGYGLENTKQRLAILYGDNAQFSIDNTKNSTVRVEVTIPLNN